MVLSEIPGLSRQILAFLFLTESVTKQQRWTIFLRCLIALRLALIRISPLAIQLFAHFKAYKNFLFKFPDCHVCCRTSAEYFAVIVSSTGNPALPHFSRKQRTRISCDLITGSPNCSQENRCVSIILRLLNVYLSGCSFTLLKICGYPVHCYQSRQPLHPNCDANSNIFLIR